MFGAAVTLASCGANPNRALNDALPHSPDLRVAPARYTQSQFTVLYRFRGGTDGGGPQGRLLFDASGALYGTTEGGGAFSDCGFYHNNGCGTVFKLTPSGSGYSESILHSFKGLPTDGAWPWSGLVIDAHGALYGTTSSTEGSTGCGTVFKLTPTASGYAEGAIYGFGGLNCFRGDRPYAGVALGKNGSLFGTTFVGGGFGDGNVFELKPSGLHYAERFMHSFGGSDGGNPLAELTEGKHGVFYGTTQDGGSTHQCGFYDNGCGTVFELSRRGSAGYKLVTIHSFDLSDGAQPSGGVISDTKGTLYGTAAEGGSGTCSGFTGCGVVFKLTPSASGYTETVLYSFEGTNDSDGAYPTGMLAFDKSGALYGTTYRGGTPSCDCGTVFKLTPSGSGYKESVLHLFGGPDGQPRGGLILGKDGALYGTATTGIVFKVQP